jgi:hypothetical protein
MIFPDPDTEPDQSVQYRRSRTSPALASFALVFSKRTYRIKNNFFREMKAHCYAEKHTKSKSVECSAPNCGKVFQGSSSGGLQYHR